MTILVGTPSDDAPAIPATGRTDISVIYVSMSERHPDGRDADYMQWHSLDHRPEQYRLATLRNSSRLVSTPACRAARAASDPRYDATDHFVSYLFSDPTGLEGFIDLSNALNEADRVPYLLPCVERAVYRLAGTAAAPRIKAGADVLPWWPATGAYVLIERGEEPAVELIDVPGVGGAWWGGALPRPEPYTTTPNTGLQITLCYLDEDPAETGERLRPVLQERWVRSGVEPLFAAPFHTLAAYEWDRYLP